MIRYTTSKRKLSTENKIYYFVSINLASVLVVKLEFLALHQKQQDVPILKSGNVVEHATRHSSLFSLSVSVTLGILYFNYWKIHRKLTLFSSNTYFATVMIIRNLLR